MNADSWGKRTMLMYVFAQLSLFGTAAAANTAECNPDSPIYVEQASVKLFHVQGGDGAEEARAFVAMAGLLGDPVLRIANTTNQSLTIHITLYGDAGFFIDHSQHMPSENTTSYTVDLAGLSTMVVPLVYQPTALPENEGDQFQSATGVAAVTIDGAVDYTDMYIETYLTGISLAFPDYSGGELDEEIESDGKGSGPDTSTP